MKNICKCCKKEYEFEPKKGSFKFKYCSVECKKKYMENDNKPQNRICENCGKEYWWDDKTFYDGNIKVDTKRFCSFECGKEYRYKKIFETTMKNHGGIGFAVKEIKDKIKQTNSEKYGNENYNNIEKRKSTNLNKYGVECASKSDIIREKQKNKWNNLTSDEKSKIEEKRQNTCLQKYGIDNVSKVNSIKEKIKQIKLQKHGNENYNNIDKIKQTNIQNYGVECYAKSNDFKDKINKINASKTKEEQAETNEKRKQTNIQRYGVEYASSADVVKQKRKNTNLSKYGVEASIKSKQIQDKIKTSNLLKYNVEYAICSKEVQEKIRKTNLKRHGYEYPFQSAELRIKMENNRKQTNLKRYGTENVIQVKEFKNKAIKTCLDKYGVPYNCLTENCIESNGKVVSQINIKVKESLDKNNIKNDIEFVLEKYSYDFICNDSVLLEINPTYTHNSSMSIKFSKFTGKQKDKYYHYNKTQVANRSGYKCMHIWDWDELDKIIDILKPKEKLYARKLSIKEVNKDDCDNFLNKYHIQNACKNQTVRLGLYMNNDLIQIMTFGKPRYNNSYEWELLRLCTKAGYVVVGGSEKLFKYFIENYNPESIISYCDNSKFTGEVYKKLGMELKDYGYPRRHWYNINTHRHITEAMLLQYGYSKLHNDTLHKKGESNEKLMLDAHYLEVYDCGQSVYIWNK